MTIALISFLIILSPIVIIAFYRPNLPAWFIVVFWFAGFTYLMIDWIKGQL